jgi:hypothetical protein
MRKIGLFIGLLLFTVAQTQRAPDNLRPVDQLLYSYQCDLYQISFYQDYPFEVDILTDEFEGCALEPESSPDGRLFAFIVEDKGQRDIILGLDSRKPLNITNNADRESEIRWAPGGLKISYTQQREGLEPELVVFDFNPFSRRVVASGVDSCCHGWVDEETVSFYSIDYGPRQIKHNKPSVMLPYEGGDVNSNQLSQEEQSLVPEQPGSSIIEAERSPSGEYIYVMYRTIGPGQSPTVENFIVYDTDYNELVSIEGVYQGQADWRP